MPGGGGAAEQTTMAPWGPVKAPAKAVMARALGLSDVEMPYYGGDTTAGMSADTTAALDMARAQATGPNLANTVAPAVAGLATGQQLDLASNPFWSSPQGQQTLSALGGALTGNPWQSAGLATGPGATGAATLTGVASGADNRPYGAIGDWAWGGSPEGAAMTRGLMATAGGQFLDPATNPTWNNYSNAAADAVQRQTAQRYLGAGQTLDNPAVNQTFSRDFASVMAPFASQMYESERGRQMAAQGQIGSLLQSGAALNEAGFANQAQRQAAAANSLLGVGASGTNDSLQAAGLMSNLYGTNLSGQLSALGMVPATMQAGFLPASVLQAAGQAGEAYTQADMNDAQMRWQYGQMEPWQRLQLLQGMVAPFFGGGGTSAAPGGGVNPAVSAAGGALSGAAAGATLGTAVPVIGNLAGAIGGAIIGGAGGYMGGRG